MSTKACCSACVGTEEQDKKLHEAISALQGEHSLVQVLQAAQEIYGYLPERVIDTIAKELGVSSETVYEVATFYSQFKFNPKGRHAISVCLGTACYVKGAGEIYEKIKEKLQIDDGQTTPDGKFSIDACRCVGACGLAPVMSINDNVYGNLPGDMIDGLLDNCQ